MQCCPSKSARATSPPVARTHPAPSSSGIQPSRMPAAKGPRLQLYQQVVPVHASCPKQQLHSFQLHTRVTHPLRQAFSKLLRAGRGLAARALARTVATDTRLGAQDCVRGRGGRVASSPLAGPPAAWQPAGAQGGTDGGDRGFACRLSAGPSGARERARAARPPCLAHKSSGQWVLATVA